MATDILVETPPSSTPPLRSQLEVVRNGSNARWGAILAGVFVSAASWLVLHMLGMGIGMIAIDSDDVDSLRAAGIGVGVWSVIAPIIALFLGGLVVSRLAPTPNRINRLIHGALVWSVATLIAATAIFMVTSRLVSGAARAGGAVVGGAAGAIREGASATDRGTLEALGIDAGDLVGPINERLRAEGKPEITADQLRSAAREAIGTAVRTGDFDRDALASALASNTALSRSDVEDLAGRIEAQWNQARQRGGAMLDRAGQGALEAAEATGGAITLLSIALLLGLAAAMGGALITGRYDRRRVSNT